MLLCRYSQQRSVVSIEHSSLQRREKNAHCILLAFPFARVHHVFAYCHFGVPQELPAGVKKNLNDFYNYSDRTPIFFKGTPSVSDISSSTSATSPTTLPTPPSPCTFSATARSTSKGTSKSWPIPSWRPRTGDRGKKGGEISNAC